MIFVANEVSDPILSTINFLKVCTKTSFAIILILEPGGAGGLGGEEEDKQKLGQVNSS